MLRGFAPAMLLLAGACTIAAQTTAQAPSTSPQSPSQSPPASASASSQSSQQTPPQETPPHALHYITVTFNYDFTKTPACAAKNPANPCVSQFAIFETTGGEGKNQRIFLFNVPLPPKPKGVVNGITQQSPAQIDFVLGWHRLGVAALGLDGRKSTLRFCDSCATWINVQTGPSLTPSTPAPGSSTTPPATLPPTP